MHHKKNILLLIPELGNGGAEHSLLKLAHILKERHEVKIVVFTNAHTQYKIPVPVISLQTSAARNPFTKLWMWVLRIKRLNKVKMEHNNHITISFLEGADYLNCLTRSVGKIILSVRGSKQHDRQISGVMGWIRKSILMPLLYRRANAIVVVSKAIGGELKQLHIPDEKVVHIPNFYNIEDIRAKAVESLTPQEKQIYDRPVIINSGRFHPQKEHKRLLDVFAKIMEASKCRLVLLGEGDLKEEIVRHAQQLGLRTQDFSEGEVIAQATQVLFLGFQQNPYKYIHHATMFALTSSWEGFPNVLLEAMICGVPVVSTDCPTGPREILDMEVEGDAPVQEAKVGAYGVLMPLLIDDEKLINSWKTQCLHVLEGGPTVVDRVKAAQQRTEQFDDHQVAKLWEALIEEN